MPSSANKLPFGFVRVSAPASFPATWTDHGQQSPRIYRQSKYGNIPFRLADRQVDVVCLSCPKRVPGDGSEP